MFLARPVSGSSVQGGIRLPNGGVSLSGLEPVASGQDRLVYLHPDYPDVLFKVLRDPAGRPMPRTFRGITQRLFPSVRYRPIRKEYEAYLALLPRMAGQSGEIPITHLYGLCQTDLGPATMVERIGDQTHPVGESLRTMALDGTFDAAMVPLLNDFAERLLRWQVRTTDMTMQNIVLGLRAGRRQFVLVDGIGDVFAIPIRTWSVTAMRIGQRQSLAAIARKLGLGWDARTHRFLAG
jgi:hypothetical protein